MKKKKEKTKESIDVKKVRLEFGDTCSAARLEMNKFFDDNEKKSAGPSRKYLQSIKKLSQLLRIAIQEQKSSM